MIGIACCPSRVAENARLSQHCDVQDAPMPVAAAAGGQQLINDLDYQGMTPLQIALKLEHIENAEVLIANGADIHIRYLLWYR